MPIPSSRTTLLAALALALAAPGADAQSSSSARERARLQRERMEREQRERAYRERIARLERERRERQAQLDRERRSREALARRAAERRQEGWSDDTDRPRITLGGGVDVRRFGGNDNRYIVQGGVDFRTRSGLGMRPEVFYAWTDAPTGAQVVTGPTGAPIGTIAFGRSRALGVSLNATYTFLRGAPVRPYVLGGIGLVSTRESLRATGTVTPQPGPSTTDTRNQLDIGLNSGAGLEFALGPVRLFTEVRYFLSDTPLPRGFSGMLPISAGLRF